MMHADRDITLFNYYSSPEDPNVLRSKRTCFTGVSVFAQTKVSVDTKGLQTANVHIIRIPADAAKTSYASPVVFRALADKARHFTLAKGDRIVLGHADDEDPTKAALERRYGTDMVVTITGVTGNLDGRAPHWKVTGE